MTQVTTGVPGPVRPEVIRPTLPGAIAPRVSPETDEGRLTAVRAALPAVARGGYFNSGYTGPLSAAAYEAASRAAAHEFEHGRMGGAHKATIAAILADARERVAGLIGTTAGQIALTHHTTDGTNLVAQGLPWAAGDNAVTTRVEHKGGILPLGVVRRRFGVEVRAVDWDVTAPAADLVDRVVAAIDDRTRLVMLSHVPYVNGAVLDLAPVVEAAHRHGALVCVDGAQSVGVIPVDVTASGVDAYTVSGQKWLCGPEDTGALYVAPHALDRIGQTTVGWASVTTWTVDGGFEPNPDVSRFEVGTRCNPQLAGLAASIRWLTGEVGLDWAFRRTYDLAELARERLARHPGALVLTPAEHTGLVSVRLGPDPDGLVRRMGERGFTIRSIYGYDCVRLSIGFFHTEAEVVNLVDTLLSIANDA